MIGTVFLIIFKSFSLSQTKDSCNNSNYGIVINPLIGWSQIDKQNTFIKGVSIGFQFNNSESGFIFKKYLITSKSEFYGQEKSDYRLSGFHLYFKKYFKLSEYASLSVSHSLGYHDMKKSYIRQYKDKSYHSYEYISNKNYIFTEPEIALYWSPHKNFQFSFGYSYRLIICEYPDFIHTSPYDDEQLSGFNFLLGLNYIIRL